MSKKIVLQQRNGRSAASGSACGASPGQRLQPQNPNWRSWISLLRTYWMATRTTLVCRRPCQQGELPGGAPHVERKCRPDDGSVEEAPQMEDI